MTLYIASWCETEAAPGKAPAAGSWVPMEWEKARTTLLDQLERNLEHWGNQTGLKADYIQAKLSLERATDERPKGLVIWLRDHKLSILPAS